DQQERTAEGGCASPDELSYGFSGKPPFYGILAARIFLSVLYPLEISKSAQPRAAVLPPDELNSGFPALHAVPRFRRARNSGNRKNLLLNSGSAMFLGIPQSPRDQ